MFVNVKIEKEKAEELLSEKKRFWPARKKLIKVELFHLPLFLFTVSLKNKKGSHYQEMISVDGIKGEFAFFRETGYDQQTKETDNKFSFTLTEQMAGNIALGEYQRFLLKNNLRNSNTSVIEGFSQGVQVYYPYWIGYFKRREGYDFEVIDAVAGGKQGIKMRPVFIDLILQTKGTI